MTEKCQHCGCSCFACEGPGSVCKTKGYRDHIQQLQTRGTQLIERARTAEDLLIPREPGTPRRLEGKNNPGGAGNGPEARDSEPEAGPIDDKGTKLAPAMAEMARRMENAKHRSVWMTFDTTNGAGDAGRGFAFLSLRPDVADRARKLLDDAGLLCGERLGSIGDGKDGG